MRIVKVKVVDSDIEFEMEIPDYLTDKHILKLAQLNAEQLVGPDRVDLLIEEQQNG